MSEPTIIKSTEDTKSFSSNETSDYDAEKAQVVETNEIYVSKKLKPFIVLTAVCAALGKSSFRHSSG